MCRSTSEAPLDRTRPDGSPLRTGYTTGANACAAACAAARVLVGLGLDAWEGPLPELTADRYDTLAGSILIHLPNGEPARLPVRVAERRDDAAYASVIKDAGDDPDCTHRAEHWAEVRLRADGAVALARGAGVGVVTRPGLGLPVGGPAINSGPRENIIAEVKKIVPSGADVVLGITDGEVLAKKTLNARLGVLGGLSILGTSGVVYPYSTAAFRASVAQGIDVAHTLGADQVVLTTGGRSERFAMELLPELPEPAFVQMGDFIGFALNHAARLGLRRATVVGMIGKLSKMADGRTMTHAAGSEVNTALLAELARGIGADEALCAAIAGANTGRHAQELVTEAGLVGFFDALCERVSVVLSAHVHGRLRIDVFLVDFSGPPLGRFTDV
ncbi:cobalt-precorrin-5B (C(1))-methyltransferase [Myxococcota bacterium]|nr:cobalt-precorrin-5B (C(1))-methyltransferase [Myxococcota bacterium]